MTAATTTAGELVGLTSAPVANIIVSDRHRKDLGDIDGLAASIADVGLINPISITWDYDLIAGERRLAAVRQLGWDEVPVRALAGLDDAAADLRAERDENTCRKAMTASEDYALGKELEAMKRPEAIATQGTRTDLAATSGSSDPEVANPEANKTYTKVGNALGKSGPTWKRLKHIGDRAADGDQAATEALAAVDSGEKSITSAYHQLRDLDKGHEPDQTPTRRNLPTAERAAQIAKLAATGHVASQIANEIGVGAERVRQIARDAGIVLPDTAIGSRARPDSNRIVRETVSSAEGCAFGLNLIDYQELDRSQIEEWTSSLSESIRALNRLNTKLKELAHDQA